jgi:cytochrome o ubiquinol oxidase subunit 1
LQLIVSIVKRNENRVGNDPWNGRTLEWSIASPPQEYNYTVIPTVTHRDEFWEMKRRHHVTKPEYTDIWLPKNTGAGVIVGLFALIFGAAIIWHIIWLVIVGLVGVIITLIIRLTNDETEEKLTAAEVAKRELKRQIA